MTYTGFLLLFLLLPLGILVVLLRRRLLDKRYFAIVCVLTLVALMYMAPWDHFAATWRLWSWEKGRTWGIRWWAIPPEEYLFCTLEALLAITLTFAMLTRKDKQSGISLPKSLGDGNPSNFNSASPPGQISLDKTIVHTSPSPKLNERTGLEDGI